MDDHWPIQARHFEGANGINDDFFVGVDVTFAKNKKLRVSGGLSEYIDWVNEETTQ